MTQLQDKLREIRERSEAASKGPWKAYDWPEFPRRDEAERCVRIESEFTVTAFCYDGDPNHDALFIAHARTDIPALLAALELAIEQRDQLLPTEGYIHQLNKPILRIISPNNQEKES